MLKPVLKGRWYLKSINAFLDYGWRREHTLPEDALVANARALWCISNEGYIYPVVRTYAIMRPKVRVSDYA